jgi:hypothetical protein
VTSKPSRGWVGEAIRSSQESTKTRTMYRPRVLFEIGREVKTINDLSSNQLLELKSDIDCNWEHSFQQLLDLKNKGAFKENRASIDCQIVGDKRDSYPKAPFLLPSRDIHPSIQAIGSESCSHLGEGSENECRDSRDWSLEGTSNE